MEPFTWDETARRENNSETNIPVNCEKVDIVKEEDNPYYYVDATYFYMKRVADFQVANVA